MRSGASGQRIGPGRLVVVVGPSGAGKDTLIGIARGLCADDSTVVFPRRIVTRPPSAHEEHDTVPVAAFERAVAQGAFAFWWQAHGLRYALPLSVVDDIRDGHPVVCNVSRTIVSDLRLQFAYLVVVLVSAPPEILAERLVRRGRTADGTIQDRIGRSSGLNLDIPIDVRIENVGDPEAGGRLLAAAIWAHRPSAIA